MEISQCLAIAKSTRQRCKNIGSHQLGSDPHYCHLHQKVRPMADPIQIDFTTKNQQILVTSSTWKNFIITDQIVTNLRRPTKGICSRVTQTQTRTPNN